MKKGNQGEGGGRPAKVLTPVQAEEVEKLASMLSKKQIAEYYGMTEKTFRAVEERQEEVFTAYKRGKSKAIVTVAANLIQQAQNGNTSAAIFYLKTQAGWKETDRHEIVGDEEQPFVWKIQVMNNSKVIENNQ
tara:strand:+ start:3563 stop:3961 length:399 start_codon:yes stop_codon:yes gene_type:complete